jgi:hypothetical protein
VGEFPSTTRNELKISDDEYSGSGAALETPSNRMADARMARIRSPRSCSRGVDDARDDYQ